MIFYCMSIFVIWNVQIFSRLFPLLSCSQCSFYTYKYTQYVFSSNVQLRYENRYYMNIITGQTNSFSRWVYSANAVSIVGNVYFRVQSSDPNLRPATSHPLNKGTSNGLSYVENFVAWSQFRFLANASVLKIIWKIKVGNFTVCKRVYIKIFQFLSFKWKFNLDTCF